MSKALQLTGGSDVKETVKFVEMFDKFFDSFNVNSYNTGRLKRKIFKQPYRSATDFRLKVQCVPDYLHVISLSGRKCALFYLKHGHVFVCFLCVVVERGLPSILGRLGKECDG